MGFYKIGAILLAHAALGLAACLLAIPTLCQQTTGLTKARPTKKVRLAPSLPEEEACLRISANTGNDLDYYFVQVQHFDSPLTTRLRVLLRSEGNERALLTYEHSDHLVYMFPTSPRSDLLVTVWEGGDHEAVRVFHLEKDKATLVFERGGKLLPEFVDGPHGATILLNRTENTGGGVMATKTAIYAWDGKQYALQATVPFEDRYAALDKLTRRAKK